MSEYLTLQSRYYALLKMCYFKAYSNVIEGFSVSGASLEKLTPFEGPLEHVFYSEQARILKTQSSMWWC